MENHNGIEAIGIEIINAIQKSIFIEERNKRISERKQKLKEQQEQLLVQEKENDALIRQKYFDVKTEPEKYNKRISEVILSEINKKGECIYSELLKLVEKEDKDILKKVLTKMVHDKILKFINYSQTYILRK